MDTDNPMKDHFNELLNAWKKKYFPNYPMKNMADEFELSRHTVASYFRENNNVIPSGKFLYKLKIKYPKIDLNQIDPNCDLELPDQGDVIKEANRLKRETELLNEQVQALKDHVNTLKTLQSK